MKQINPDVPILLFSEDEPMPLERLMAADAFLPKSEPTIVLATLKALLTQPKTTRGAPDQEYAD